MIKAKTLISSEKSIVPWIISLIFLYLIITTLYTMSTGDELFDKRKAAASIAMPIGIALMLFLAVIYPKRYPEEFLKYKKHVRKNIDKKVKIGFYIIASISFLLLLVFAFFLYDDGWSNKELVEDSILVLGGNVIMLLSLYFIHICEKD